MNYIVLVAPFLIILTIILGLIFICFKKIWVGLSLIILALIYNYYIESVPFNITLFNKKGDLRILTYNIYSSSEYFMSVEENPREVYEMLISENPDIIVLEEFYNLHCRALQDSLLKTYPYNEWQKFNCSNAVFSKYPLSDWHEMVIDLESDEMAEYKLRSAQELDELRRMQTARYIAGVTVHTSETDSLRLISCHMASNHFDMAREYLIDSLDLKNQIKIFFNCLRAGRLEREVEAKYIMREVREWNDRGGKVIVLGDMNDVPGSKTLKDLRAGGILKNAWWERGFGPGLTFHNHKVMHYRLDHVLHTKNLKLTDIRVLDVEYSDHRPVIADFE